MKKQYLYAIIAIVLWSTTATITKLLLNSLDTMQFLFSTSTLAFLFLLIYNIIKGNIKQLKETKKSTILYLLPIGLLGTFFYDLFFCLGISRMPVSEAYIINYTWPIMTIIFAIIILKEKITLKKVVAIILSFIGVAIIISNGDPLSISTNNIMGSIFCLIGAMSYGLFSVLNKKINDNEPLAMMLYYGEATIITFIYIVITKSYFYPQINEFLGLIWMGVFTCAIACTLWVSAIKEGDTTKISNLTYMAPFLSLIWAKLILKEDITIYSIIGLILIVSGILLQLKNDNMKG